MLVVYCWSGQCASLIYTTPFANLCSPLFFFFNSLGKRQRTRKHPHRPLPPGTAYQSPSAGTASSSLHHHVTHPSHAANPHPWPWERQKRRGGSQNFPITCCAWPQVSREDGVKLVPTRTPWSHQATGMHLPVPPPRIPPALGTQARPLCATV